MKDVIQNLLANLPKILEVLPSVLKLLPAIIILLILGLGGYWLYMEAPPLYVCYNNQSYELQFFSRVYKFKGDTCIQM